jgi:hypothetical protein
VSRYRLVYLGLGIALVAVAVAAWALSDDGEIDALPRPVEHLSPAPDATVLRQSAIVVDMVTGYSIELVVDGVAIPRVEVTSSEALGRYEWEPGPGRVIDSWAPGRHDVSISWTTLSGLPDLGSFTWSFRVQ